jgi:predicted nucleotidyltransferase
MLKKGKYRALRNIPVGWLTQALHSTDRSERYFRVVLEVILFTLTAVFLMAAEKAGVIQSIILAFLIVHTLLWFLTGNFWVYMLDSFLIIRNPGMPKILSFVEFSRKYLTRFNAVEAILIYGSMCRKQFHGRSDLDLRVIRRRGSFVGWLALPISFLLRAYSFFIMLPVDLEVVDSLQFLKKQMREDEFPIIVYAREAFSLTQNGMVFEEIQKNPQLVMRPNEKMVS